MARAGVSRFEVRRFVTSRGRAEASELNGISATERHGQLEIYLLPGFLLQLADFQTKQEQKVLVKVGHFQVRCAGTTGG